jgi:hypothetical protein
MSIKEQVKKMLEPDEELNPLEVWPEPNRLV